MDKQIFDRLVQEATETVLSGYEQYAVPPVPIYSKVFNREKFAELVLREAIYIGGGLVNGIEPQYNGVVTVHEAASWQTQMREHFKISPE